jgi:hypothetical protein
LVAEVPNVHVEDALGSGVVGTKWLEMVPLVRLWARPGKPTRC